MIITIEPFKSYCRGVEIDTGIDAIMLTENGTTTQIGVIGRDRHAPIQLFEDGLAPVIIAAVKATAADRDTADVPDEHKEAARANVRQVQEPPPAIEEDEEDEDDFEE